jgi:hypothetical protein
MEKILNEHNLDSLKKGDKIYQTELTSVDGEMSLVTHELIFDRYLNNKEAKIEHLEGTSKAQFAELHTIKAPKVPIKTDISCGFFSSEQEAIWEFVNMLKIVYKKALSEYESKYGKFKSKQL